MEVCKETTGIPEKYKNHVYAGVYEYEEYEKDTGLFNPCPVKNFLVVRPHATLPIPIDFNGDADPFPRLEEVTMDSKDFLLVTASKTGTHLTYEIMRMLVSGNAGDVDITYNQRWIDVALYDEIISASSSPRILTTHLPLTWLPPNFRKKGTKVVMTLRNLKDVFVSFYQHLEGKESREQRKTKPWAEYFHYLLHSKRATFSSYFDIYADIWDNYRRDPDVLIVHFEQLVKSKREVVREIANHLDLELTDELLEGIVAATEFKTMKKTKHEKEERLRMQNGENWTIYRHGKVGTWKHWFTVAQNEEFHRVFDEWNKDRQIPFEYE